MNSGILESIYGEEDHSEGNLWVIRNRICRKLSAELSQSLDIVIYSITTVRTWLECCHLYTSKTMIKSLCRCKDLASLDYWSRTTPSARHRAGVGCKDMRQCMSEKWRIPDAVAAIAHDPWNGHHYWGYFARLSIFCRSHFSSVSLVNDGPCFRKMKQTVWFAVLAVRILL
jgi:hypothetical protein